MSLAGEERKALIMQTLELEGKVKTYDLVEKLNVSSETVRRCLEELEGAGRLKRVYGGAVKTDVDREEPVYRMRETLRADEKRKIGRAAASLVEDNDVLFIDDGTTSLQMIDFLLDRKNLTVMTISVAGLNMLIDYANRGMFSGEIHFVGGRIDPAQSRSTGSVAEKTIERFYADKAFISIDGIRADRGITGFDAERGMLVRKLTEHAKMTFVLTDRSKFGQEHFFKIADLREIDAIVSDAAAPEGWAEELDDKQVEWIRAE